MLIIYNNILYNYIIILVHYINIVITNFVITIFMYRASLICVQKVIMIEVNKLLSKFIWNGKDKVKRLSLIYDLDKGGLKAPHLE